MRAISRPGFRVRLAIVAVALAVISASTVVLTLRTAYRSSIASAESTLRAYAASAVTLTDGLLLRAGNLLAALARDVALAESRVRPEREAAIARDLADAAVLLPNSRTVAFVAEPASGGPASMIIRGALQAEIALDQPALARLLAFHRASGSPALRIGDTIAVGPDRRWVIPVSRRVSRADGGFAGAVVVFVEIQSFAAAYQSYLTGSSASLGIVRSDTLLLYREPLLPALLGRSFADALPFRGLAHRPEGVYRTVSLVDRVDRIIAFRRSSDFPVVILVSASADETLAAWKSEAINMTLLLAFFLAALAALVWILARETERRARAESAADTAAARLDAAATNLPGAVFQRRLTADGKLEYPYLSPGAERIFKVPPAEIVADPAISHSMIPGDQLARLRAEVRRSAERMEPLEFEQQLLRADGSTIWTRSISTPRRDPDGSTVWDGVLLDVTRQHELELDIRDREAELRGLLENMQDAAVRYDAEGCVTGWNRGAAEMFGWTAEEIVGKRMIDTIVPPLRHASFASSLERARAGVPPAAAIPRETIALRRSGEEFPVELTATAVSLGGKTTYCVFVQDATARLRREEESRQTSRMQAVGQLTGGVAHEFNNLLTAVLGGAELLKAHLGESSPAARIAGRIERAALRGADLTSRLLAFSRKMPLRPENVLLKRVIDDVVHLARPLVEESIVFDLTPVADDLAVDMDPGLIQSALLNLVVNARDAMPRGGAIAIATGRRAIDAAEAGGLGVAPGAYAEIDVRDTGTGMDAATAARAFEPFFTTKPIGEGTGLGLSMVQGFVAQSGGHTSLRSAPGAGTTVTLLLPLARETAEAAPRATPAAPGPLTVLMVEDDPDVRVAGTAMLEQLGCRVIAAADGPAALAALDRAPWLDLAFIDVVLPKGLSGLDVAEAVRARRPEVRVVFTSGYDEKIIVRAGVVDPGTVLLRKPYSLEALSEMLAAIKARTAALA